jgi:cytoskeleton protein RodZ
MEVRRPEFDEARAIMSPADHDPNGPALGASRVGADLREARLRLGWSLADLAQELRIRLPFLQAIEDGRVGDLPGAAYAVGFVRTYAAALGLDPDEMARRFRAEAHEVNRKTELTFPAPVPERGVPAGAVILLGLVLAVGAYAAWYKFSDGRHADAGVSPVPERLAPLADRAPSSSISPQVASVLPPPAPAQPAPAPGAPPAAPSSPTAALAAPVVPPAPPVPVPVPVPVTLTPSAPAPSTPAPSTPAPDPSRVVLKFKADSYIQVREKQGPVLLNRVMRPGETWPVPKEANLVMTTGNAGGTDIVVDGVTAAPLGPSGAVRRDIPLEPDAIKLPSGTKLPPQSRSQ